MGPQDWLDAIQRQEKKAAQIASEDLKQKERERWSSDRRQKEQDQKIQASVSALIGFLNSTDGRLALRLLEITGERVVLDQGDLLGDQILYLDSKGFHAVYGKQPSDCTPERVISALFNRAQYRDEATNNIVSWEAKKLMAHIRHRLDIISKRY